MGKLHVNGWGWLEAADGKNLSQTRPAKSESESTCKSGPESAIVYYLHGSRTTLTNHLKIGKTEGQVQKKEKAKD